LAIHPRNHPAIERHKYTLGVQAGSIHLDHPYGMGAVRTHFAVAYEMAYHSGSSSEMPAFSSICSAGNLSC
jgi:hypothetical protein